MAVEPLKPIQPVEKPVETQAAAAPHEKRTDEASRFGPAYLLSQFHREVKPDAGSTVASLSTGASGKNAVVADANTEVAKKKEPEASAFGPAYVVADDRKASKQEMSVPFTPSSLGKTLAALPPMNPIGTASLTRLSLVKLIQPNEGDATKSKS